jgi:glycosidase
MAVRCRQADAPAYLRLRLTRLEAACGPLVPRGRAPMEFHISRACRSRCHFNQALFSLTGNVVLADFQAVRIFTQKMNEMNGAAAPGGSIRAGALNAMGLIDEILHHVVALYVAQVRPAAFNELAAELDRKAGPAEVRKALARFSREFPPQAVYQEQVVLEEYLLGTTKGVANRETVLEEMLLLWLANTNPAFSPFRELFDDSALAGETAYPRIMAAAGDFFSRLPPFGPDGQSLVDLLRAPALAFPDSLSGQLQYIREKWGLLLGKFLERLLNGMDLIREDEKMFFPGPGPATVFDAAAAAAAVAGSMAADESERFSQDREWMPSLVLLAKTAYVWLDQLSKIYRRPITTLDQIPDEELDRLAGWGFTGLWLIGIWERSPASRRIKQKCGNPEALASAYSLYRYEIAADLGGETALQNLKSRAWSRGIRLASDMVPNHMGIDSPWVVEHPEWFISLDHSPFPAYSFNGEDLSSDPRVGIFLEDHYYDRSDAAVVFKWVDRRSGAVRYMYHGNDGTRMPWNDTAQLNYLRPDVREAVARTILDVARRFPIIRFDAAMTLARKHYQRLWFPSPGTGGDIPSRAGQGLAQEKFDQAMPVEFWREIVERMGRENPDTLLLAEAFWMMESYFVRTLGMHRVYNSAFMNFLKMEENDKFRLSLKNVLEFNPEILKRYVNFMNNPDEETAQAQFGSGDKYFGACTLMAALPGLPMVGHGQVEGFREKYGMEYRKAYLDESVDGELVRRHERQIFPLLRKRALFSGVKDFLLYDFFLGHGAVDENVIAFSNRHGDERCLVVVHNRFASTAGWIRVSAAFAAAGPGGGPLSLAQRDLGAGLGLRPAPGRFVVFRDLVTGLKYIRASSELCAAGIFLELTAYQTHVFLDFRERADDAGGSLNRLAAYLGGRGCPSLEIAEREMALQPLHAALRDLCLPAPMERLFAAFHMPVGSREENEFWQDLEGKIGTWAAQAAAQSGPDRPREAIVAAILDDLLFLRRLRPAAGSAPDRAVVRAGCAVKYLNERLGRVPQGEKLLVLWIFLRRAAARASGPSRYSEWRLGTPVAGILRSWGIDEAEIDMMARLLGSLCDFAARIAVLAAGLDGTGKDVAAKCALMVEEIMADEEAQALLQANRFHGELFFHRESFALLCDRLAIHLLWELSRLEGTTTRELGATAGEVLDFMNFLPALAGRAGYKLGPFLRLLAGLVAG